MIEIVNTGSELMLGRVLNSHQQWICRTLADHGYTVARQTAVSDTPRDIEEAVRDALGRADLVITTGGLGPTSDDLTRDRIAALLGVSLEHNPDVEAQIRHYFISRGRAVPERTKVEAMVPSGALVLPNHHGTAPGLALKLAPNPYRQGADRAWVVMLPGPPRELHPMFIEECLPLLKREFPLSEDFVCRTLKTTGLGESQLEDRLAEPLKHLIQRGLDLGYCARVGEVDVRFVAHGSSAATIVAEAERITRDRAGEFIFGVDDDSLEKIIVREMTLRRRTLAIAESCTGGYIANRITDVPGASSVLLAGFVTYSNAAKTSALGVDAKTIEENGAVSDNVVRQMAEGARAKTGAHFAVATTGIAGPSGGTEQKPVGTVFLAIAGPDRTESWKELNRFDRETFKYLTAQQALARLLRRVRLNG